jgi:hypothetical protein
MKKTSLTTWIRRIATVLRSSSFALFEAPKALPGGHQEPSGGRLKNYETRPIFLTVLQPPLEAIGNTMGALARPNPLRS